MNTTKLDKSIKEKYTQLHLFSLSLVLINVTLVLLAFPIGSDLYSHIVKFINIISIIFLFIFEIFTYKVKIAENGLSKDLIFRFIADLVTIYIIIHTNFFGKLFS